MRHRAVRRDFLCLPLVELVEPLVAQGALVDEADLVSGRASEREDVLNRGHEPADVGLGAELLDELAAERFGGLLAELDCSAEKPAEPLVFDPVMAPLDEDPVVAPDQRKRLRADATLIVDGSHLPILRDRAGRSARQK